MNEVLVLLGGILVADVLVAHGTDTAIYHKCVDVAQYLVENGFEGDFFQILAGGNKDNLEELSKLAFEELMIAVEGYDVYNRNGTKPE